MRCGNPLELHDHLASVATLEKLQERGGESLNTVASSDIKLYLPSDHKRGYDLLKLLNHIPCTWEQQSRAG